MYKLGPVILDSTTGSYDLLENNTFTIYCVIQNQIDALEPLTIRWFRMGKVFKDTDTITITTTDENDDNNRIVNSTVFFNPLVPSDNLPDYKCLAFIGNRIADKIESDGIDLNVRCECVCLSHDYIFVFVSVSICLCLCAHLSICWSVCLSVCLTTYIFVLVSVCFSVSIHLLVCISVCLFACLCLFV